MKEKMSKRFIILIFIIVCLLFLLLLMCFYDSNNDKNAITTTTTTKTTKTINDNLTNDEKELLSKLSNQIINSDNRFGLYNDLSIEDTTNTNFIIFNIYQYLLDNNIEYNKELKCGVEISEERDFVISKDVINKYIQNRYNVGYNYDIKSSGYFNFAFGTEVLASIGDNYVIGCLAKSGGEEKVFSKVSKIEQTNDKIYLYENSFRCFHESRIACYNGYEYTKDTSLYNNEGIYSTIGDDEKVYNLDEAANYVFNNKLDKTFLYKHTFIKNSDGSYYWNSTEIVK